MNSNRHDNKPVRKRWETPTHLPLSLRNESDNEYSDSFESYSSDSNKANLLAEIYDKLEILPPSKFSEVLAYVQSIVDEREA